MRLVVPFYGHMLGLKQDVVGLSRTTVSELGSGAPLSSFAHLEMFQLARLPVQVGLSRVKLKG